jgi:hypothetical protein
MTRIKTARRLVTGVWVLVGGVVVLLISGCAQGVLGPLPTVDPTQAGEILVIYPRYHCPKVIEVTVTLDGQDIYHLDCGEHIVFAVPVGDRMVGLKYWTGHRTTAVTVSAGSRSHLRIDYSSTVLVLKPTMGDVAERLMLLTKARSRR